MVIRYDSFSEIPRTTWTVRIAKLMYRERGGGGRSPLEERSSLPILSRRKDCH